MRDVYRQAMEVPVSQFANLSQEAFSAHYGERPASWRIGPFAREASLTFTKTRGFDDPTGIGWRSTILGNPTLIERDGALHMFYRACPGKESLSSRIGHAVLGPGGQWADLSGPPVLYPTEPDELCS